MAILTFIRYASLVLLQRADRCNSQRNSVHPFVICPKEWNYDHAVFCIR